MLVLTVQLATIYEQGKPHHIASYLRFKIKMLQIYKTGNIFVWV